MRPFDPNVIADNCVIELISAGVKLSFREIAFARVLFSHAYQMGDASRTIKNADSKDIPANHRLRQATEEVIKESCIWVADSKSELFKGQ